MDTNGFIFDKKSGQYQTIQLVLPLKSYFLVFR